MTTTYTTLPPLPGGLTGFALVGGPATGGPRLIATRDGSFGGGETTARLVSLAARWASNGGGIRTGRGTPSALPPIAPAGPILPMQVESWVRKVRKAHPDLPRERPTRPLLEEGAWHVVTEGVDGCTSPYWIGAHEWWPTGGEDGRTEAKEAGAHGRLRRFDTFGEAKGFVDKFRKAAEEARNERAESNHLESVPYHPYG